MRQSLVAGHITTGSAAETPKQPDKVRLVEDELPTPGINSGSFADGLDEVIAVMAEQSTSTSRHSEEVAACRDCSASNLFTLAGALSGEEDESAICGLEIDDIFSFESWTVGSELPDVGHGCFTGCSSRACSQHLLGRDGGNQEELILNVSAGCVHGSEKRNRKSSRSQLLSDDVGRSNKNAIAARLNRLKKKEYITGLEGKVSVLTSENKGLKEENRLLNQRVQKLEGEVNYLKAVLANESTLAQILCRLSGVNGMKITTSLFKECSETDHDYALPRKRAKTREESSAGVCLHVDKDQVSVEFCSKCAQSASSLKIFFQVIFLPCCVVGLTEHTYSPHIMVRIKQYNWRCMLIG
ncbi:CREB/ATF bZIP transcription factor [Protopterus annectens]|uniref:CREB/ATF bZIP transcription factor n=1 Tax=Protopterus annectens TaxID=7888 RepID=UPI001CFAB517|nr:CREB/ATF bZIP transcription factor [Protopterus annectens]